MSLKAFHIVFISLSILLAFGFAAWEVNGFLATDDGMQLTAGIVSSLAGVGLILYEIRFLRKLKHVKLI